jgi:uroporphyrinogen decarboxylase
MVTPRELVRQTLEFNNPQRIARQLWTLPWASEHYPDQLAEIQKRFPDDIIGAPGFLQLPLQVIGDAYQVGTYIDEWGCIFTNIQSGVIGEVKEPFIKTWNDLDKLRLPNELLSVDVEQVNRFCLFHDHFVTGGCCPRPFERLQFLRKSENLYIDLVEQSSEFLELVHRMHEFFLKELDLWAATKVDCLNFMDDWGAQRKLLISPLTWRKIFKPLYKDYIDLAHHKGKFIFMHSDGYTAEIIPDLIELGLDALNTQLFTMDIEELGRRFAGKITFWGEIDRQHLLPHATIIEIDQAVRRVKNALYSQGGVIAQCEFGAGAQPANVYQVFKSWEEVL